MASQSRCSGAAAGVLLFLLAVGGAAFAEERVLDDFEQLSGWSAVASEGAHVWIGTEAGHTGQGMRIGFDLGAGAGYVIVRKTFALTLPENYAFTFFLRGEARPNNFEFKLVDAGGQSVWWRNQREFAFPKSWQQVTIRRSRVERAWGRAPDGHLKKVGVIEFAIAGGEGGPGSLWIDDLAFEPREPATSIGEAPEISAATSAEQHAPAFMLDERVDTAWRSEPLPREQWVLVDHRRNWEYGGLVIDWDAEDYATQYEVQVSNDGAEWTTAFSTATGHGGRSYVYMPDAESRYTRLLLQRSSRGQGYGITTLAVQPPAFSASPNRFFEAIARDGPPGAYPKYLYGRQTYWTVVGVDRDDKEGLLNEEGMLEVDRGAFSIEPFLYTDGHLITWSDVTTTQELADGSLPIATTTWRHPRLTLRVTAFAAGEPKNAMLFARYRVENHGDSGAPVHLFLALRPFQVTPPWQSLNLNGGATRIQELRFDGRGTWVDEKRIVVALTPPDQFGAVTFEEGSITDFLRAGRVPPRTQATDPLGFASGAFRYSFYLAPKDREEIALAIPLHDPYAGLTAIAATDARGLAARREEEVRREWQSILSRVELTLPPAARKISDTLRSTLAYILINRDGPAIQPGPRNYARSWIRDGALTSTALLELGCTDAPREFLRWFAQYQAPDGKVPCCVDRRGVDPVSEHDAAGEFIYAIMEYYRYTRDVGFAADLWPNVVRAVDYLTALRARRLGDEYRDGPKRAAYGLLPESISHEGYAARPVHSYWDDFFALRGFSDAADMAVVMGDDERAQKYAALRDQFRETLYASIARTMADHGIDYIPGSVELGDFDPTSTSVALVPGGEREHLPEPALTRTFDRYWRELDKRRDGADWQEYSPYEVRNVAALLRLGQKDRALELLHALLADQTPPGWNQWPEIVWRDRTAPRFIGDMPHTWVGSTYVRAVRNLIVYERESDQALVIGAGLAPEWVTAEPGVAVKRLPTHYGVLSYTARATAPDTVRFRIAGDLAVPPGGVVVASPLSRPLRSAAVDGHTLAVAADGTVVVRVLPAEVVFEYGPATGP